MKTYDIHNYGCGRYFLFDAEFKSTLPPESNGDGDWLDMEILDKETGKVYPARIGAIFYEHDDQLTQVWDEEEEDLVYAHSLNIFFYSEHCCGCHREGYILPESNPGDLIHDNDPCPDDRFFIKKLWHRSRPDLILFYEEVEDASSKS